MEAEIITPETPAPIADESQSLSDHAAQFAPGAERATPAETAPPAGTETAPASEADAAAAARDEQGRFAKAPKHRAVKQQATAADTPRIAELTQKWRETERERDELRAKLAERETAPATPAAPPPRAAVPDPSLDRLPADFPPEPSDADFANYSDFVKAHNRWSAKAELALHTMAQQRQQAERSRYESFTTRVNAAKQKYPDFEQVALVQPSRIQMESVIGHYIMEHKAGAELLYHFQKNDADLTRVLALPVLEQIDELALLAHRLTAPKAPVVAPSRPVVQPPVVAPRPPTLVRTGAPTTTDEPPGDDNMSIDTHAKYYGPKAVRR